MKHLYRLSAIRIFGLASTLMLCALPLLLCSAQDVYSTFTNTVRNLYRLNTESELDLEWNKLVLERKIPLVAGDSVAFLYRGEARTVTWMGDFNGWGANKGFVTKGTRIRNTDVWILKASLPADARLDYKILLDGDKSILDPVNPWHQWSGVGGGSLNSELRMPAWQEDLLTAQPLPEAVKGSVISDILFTSHQLGYQVTYTVYTPPGYSDGKPYPVLYVTDGYEYLHERMGNMRATLDNLIWLRKIEPLVVVFIDHREPANRSHNRRMSELSVNDKYTAFLTGELLPAIEESFSVSHEWSERGIIGSSLGGLYATWVSFSKPEVFGRVGAQSPAFWYKPDIYSLCDRSNNLPRKVFLSAGLIHDAEDGARKMCSVLEKKKCPYYLEAVNQGHSWGNWRDLVDDMLIYLFPANQEIFPAR